MDKLYCEATIQKSLVNGQEWETDENGNPIVLIEASNDNLDFQEERVLQDALMGSKDYFLKNGVISYDHMHLPSEDNYKKDPEWNEEKYILGHPLDAFMENGVVKVKAALYKSVDRAKEIIKKLTDGAKTVKASVGGRRPTKINKYDYDLMKDIPTIIKVLWDEVALTYKPVNQTLGPTILSPKEFVKSLTAGNSVDPGAMTDGNALQYQSVDGRGVVQSLLSDISFGEVEDSKEAIARLMNNGYSEEQAKEIIGALINNNLIGDVLMAGEKEDMAKAIDDSTDALLKAIAASKDDKEVKEDDDEMKKAKKKAPEVAEEKDEDLFEDDEEEKEDDDEDDEEDVTEDIEKMGKSIETLRTENQKLGKMVKSLGADLKQVKDIVSALGENGLAVSKMVKSIADAPLPRKSETEITPVNRFAKSVGDGLSKMTKDQIRALGRKAVTSGLADVDFVDRINYKFQKSMPFEPDMIAVLDRVK
jgi:hypothetical protein